MLRAVETVRIPPDLMVVEDAVDFDADTLVEHWSIAKGGAICAMTNRTAGGPKDDLWPILLFAAPRLAGGGDAGRIDDLGNRGNFAHFFAFRHDKFPCC